MTQRQKLEACRRAYAKGAKAIEITHPDDTKSCVVNPAAIAAAMAALNTELNHQLSECDRQ